MAVNPQDVVKDPDFLSLPRGEKQKVLHKIDPNFSGLDLKQQGVVLDSLRPELPGRGFFGSAKEDIKSTVKSGVDTFHDKYYDVPVGEGLKNLSDLGFHAITGAALLPFTAANAAYDEFERPSGESVPVRAGKAAFTALGGSPRDVEQRLRQGDKGGALYELTKTVAPLLAAEVGGEVAKFLPGLSEETAATPIVTKEAKSNLKSLLGNDLPKQAGERLDAPGGMIDRMNPYLKMAAKNLGYSEKDLDAILAGKEYELSHPVRSLTGRDPKEYRVSKGVDARRAIFEEGERIFGRQFDTLMQEYSGQTISPEKMGSAISANIDRYTEFAAPKMAARLKEIGADAAGSEFKTIGEWDKLRKKYNSLAADAFKAMQAGQTGYDMDTVDAYRRTVDAIRDAEYSQLGQLSGLPKSEIEQLQQLHRDAVQMKMANEDVTQRAEASQAEHQNSLAGRVVAGRSGERSPSVRRGIVSALLPGPQGEQNIAFRRSLKGANEAGTPDRILPSMRDQKQLPQPGPVPVEIPTEVSKVVQQGKTGAIAPNREGNLFVESSPSPEGYEYKRQFENDYVGSGKEGELPVLGPSEVTGQNAGTMTVKTPKAAQDMLESLDGINMSGLDSATQAKVEETIRSLEKLAAHRQLPTGPAARRMRVEKGRPGVHRTRKALPGIKAGIYAGARSLTPLQDQQ